MNKMIERKVTYNTALIAKYKGFDENVDCVYYFDTKRYYYHGVISKNSQIDNAISIPSQCQLQKWLREKHNIHICIWHNDLTEKYRVDNSDDDKEYKTYEEALETALYEALNLI